MSRLFQRAVSRRFCSTTTITPSQLLQLTHDSANALPTILGVLADQAHRGDVELRTAAFAALAKYDASDAHTEEISAGHNRLSGAEIVASALEHHLDSKAICDDALRVMINLCFLTITDSSASSNQSLLGAESAVHHAAQVLHKYGRDDEKLCSRGLHALLMLTMYSDSNVADAVTYGADTLCIAMLAAHEGSVDVQDTGLALLVRLLNAPLKDSTKVDYLYEENPLTSMHAFLTAAQQHPLHTVHEKAWQGLALLAHNHAILPDLARELSRAQMITTLTDVLGDAAVDTGMLNRCSH